MSAEQAQQSFFTELNDSQSQDEIGKAIDNLFFEEFDISRQCYSLIIIDDTLILGYSNGRIELRNPSTFNLIDTLEGHTREVNAFSKAGPFLASKSTDSTIKLWNIQTRELKYQINNILTWRIEQISHYLAEFGRYGIKLYDLNNLGQVPEIELEFYSKCPGNLIEFDNLLIFSKRKENNLIIWDIEANQQVGQLEGHTTLVQNFVITNGMLVSGSDNGEIICWDVQNQKQHWKVQPSQDIINFLKTLNDWVVSLSVWTIRLLNPADQTLVCTIYNYQSNMRALVSYESTIITSQQDKIFIWKFDAPNQNVDINSNERIKLNQEAVVVNNIVVYGTRQNLIKLWNSQSQQHLDSIEVPYRYDYLASIQGLLVIISCQDIYIWNVENYTQLECLKGHTKGISSFGEYKNQLMTGSSDKTLRLWDLKAMQQIKCAQIDFEPTCIVTINSLVAVAGVWKLELWDIMQETKVKQFDAQGECFQIGIEFNEYLIFGDNSCQITVWDIQADRKVSQFEGHRNSIETLVVFNDYLLSGVSEEIKLWNIWNLGDGFYGKFALLNTSTIVVVYGNKIELKTLQKKYWTIEGDYSHLTDLKQYVNGKASQYKKEFNQYQIAPMNINALHMLAYKGLNNQLQQALESGCRYTQMTNGKTPLSIALDGGFTQCQEIILKYFTQIEDQYEKNRIFGYLCKDFIRILSLNSFYLTSFFDQLMINQVKQVQVESLPKFFSNQFQMLDSQIKEIEASSKNVKISTSHFLQNILEGSQESIDIINGLLNTEKTELLRSDYVQSFVGYKIEYFFRILLLYAFLAFLNPLLSIGITFIDDTTTKTVIIIVLLVNTTLLAIFELIQVFSIGKSYIYEVKNYLDCLRLISVYIWAIYLLLTDFDKSNDWEFLCVMAIALIWIEGLSVFQIFNQTRYYIWLIWQVIQDMIGFFFILLYFILAYTTILGYTFEDGLIQTLQNSYQLLLGEFDVESFSTIQWLIFITGSMLILVIMLNLFISIISESFDKISFEKVESDTKIRLKLILEMENCMFWNRQKEDQRYLTQVSEYNGDDIGEEQWESRVRMLYKNGLAIKQQNEEQSKTVDKRFSQIDNRINQVEEKVDRILSLLSEGH